MNTSTESTNKQAEKRSGKCSNPSLIKVFPSEFLACHEMFINFKRVKSLPSDNEASSHAKEETLSQRHIDFMKFTYFARILNEFPVSIVSLSSNVVRIYSLFGGCKSLMWVIQQQQSSSISSELNSSRVATFAWNSFLSLFCCLLWLVEHENENSFKCYCWEREITLTQKLSPPSPSSH